jgi:hypothetical protein
VHALAALVQSTHLLVLHEHRSKLPPSPALVVVVELDVDVVVMLVVVVEAVVEVLVADVVVAEVVVVLEPVVEAVVVLPVLVLVKPVLLLVDTVLYVVVSAEVSELVVVVCAPASGETRATPVPLAGSPASAAHPTNTPAPRANTARRTGPGNRIASAALPRSPLRGYDSTL